MPDGGQHLVESLSPFWHHQKGRGPRRKGWVKRMVEVQGHRFWVVRLRVRKWVRFLVKEWG